MALDQYAVVGNPLAIRYERKTVRAHWALHVLVFLSFLCIVLFAGLGDFRVWWLAASLILLCAALVTNYLGRRMFFDNQALDYRAVAEAARVRILCRGVGIEDSVADNYLEEQRTELDWIRNALRGWDAALCPTAAGESENARVPLEFALKHWVEHQRHYFSKASRVRLERARIASICGLGPRWLAYWLWGWQWPVLPRPVLISRLKLAATRGARLVEMADDRYRCVAGRLAICCTTSANAWPTPSMASNTG